MVTFFGELDNVCSSSDGIDLIGEKLTDLQLLDIYTEITNLGTRHPDDYCILKSRESLLTLLGEHEEAIDLISQKNILEKHPNLQLNLAGHLGAMGRKEEIKDLLSSLILKQETTVDLLIAFIAAGTLDKKDEAVTIWNKILEAEEITDLTIDDDVLEYPDEYSCLSGLPMREVITGLEILQRYGIRENYEVELYFFVDFIKIYLEGISDNIYQTLDNEGPYEALPGFLVAEAVGDNGFALATKLCNVRPVEDPSISLRLHTCLNDIKKYTSEYSIGNRLIESLHTDAINKPGFLKTLQTETGGDECQVFEMLYHLEDTGISDIIPSLMDEMERNNPDIRSKTIEQSRKFPGLWENPRSEDWNYDDPEEELYDTLDELMEKREDEKAFEFLTGNMREGRLLSESGVSLYLAGNLGKMDEMTDFIPMFKEKELNQYAYLLEGYQFLLRKDIKRGLDLVNRSIQAGFSEEDAMIHLARFLNQSGYPKRTIGICEKLLKKPGSKVTEIYPALIEAYRMQGKEKEATEAEDKFKKIISG
ncbi:tetratricopeptide repeat protein [Methanospirillum stamsii]|uniref:Uncharacterized protein n=1 Tax=Methanospirillum stamsii TaxID=1277351 RepID=A0A2V2NGI8_9EURY|nr:hypothetical protein [Methanospirillum stamsii]PWR75498.1 hypothetical protein DLD82_05055 [Methanospirillum stamsii]